MTIPPIGISIPFLPDSDNILWKAVFPLFARVSRRAYTPIMAILSGLNERQKEAVLYKDGALLIVAGAGSGKTKTVAHRIAYLISLGVAPEHILAVTFTNKAAEEMRERITKLLKEENMPIEPERMPFMGTFHALGAHIVREDGAALGIPRHFSILDEDDSRSIVKDLVEELELDPESFAPARLRTGISRLKNEMVSPETLAQDSGGSFYETKLACVYSAYEDRLAKMRALDFDDLLLKPLALFDRSPETRRRWQKKWSHIHIDEYQDTNRAQYILSKILAGDSGNIAVVGDIDQAIYSWRGADWRNILQFELDWPEAKVITLEDNYRSTRIILEAANAVIVNNKSRKEKTLRATKGEGETVTLTVLENEKQEAMLIAEYVRTLKVDGVAPGSIAVLFRTNAQSRAIEEAFLKKNIAYKLIAGVKFYERKEIKDVLAYFKLALNPEDLVSIKRAINTPVRGIGKATVLKYIGKKELSAKENAKIKVFENLMKDLREEISHSTASDALRTIIKRAGFETHYKTNKLEHPSRLGGRAEAEDRLENVAELISVAKKFDALAPPEGIERLLTEAALATEQTEVEKKENDEVILLTAHAAKGLEFDVVIIAGMEEGLFPHALSQTKDEIEEERRLFYVALTRAREKILITLARHRMLYGDILYNDPSRFLGEIPEHLISGTDLSFSKKDYDDETSIW